MVNHKETLIDSLIFSVIIVGKMGHIKRYCQKLKRENKKKSYNNDKKEGNNNEDVAIGDDLSIACNSCVENVNLSCDEMNWVLGGAYYFVTSINDYS